MAETPGTAEHQQPEEAKGCPVEMYRGRRCGRPIYNAPAGVDKVPVCLMHSRDPAKDDAEFQQEFERILEAAGEGIADFMLFVFPSARYEGRTFAARCIFYQATFLTVADFERAKFSRGASFLNARFTDAASFFKSEFKSVNFTEARFTGAADFSHTKFHDTTSFIRTKFAKEAYFNWATFAREADFNYATFKAHVVFRETDFLAAGHEIGGIFCNARFEKPKKVTFYRTYLGKTLFHNCDVSGFVFSNVEWRDRPENGKHMVFEEVVGLNLVGTEALMPPEGSGDERDYGLIAELYQQLKKNFDDRRDYWTAGDFQWGEVEMKRLSSRHSGWRRWLHQYSGLAAWYKYLSEYGESYVRPAALLGLVLLLFITFYPWAGFQTTSGEISYEKFTQFAAQRNWPWWSGLAFLGHGLLTTISVMALQRDVIQTLSYPWGRALALLELLLTSTLIALFFLAVRRQFRR